MKKKKITYGTRKILAFVARCCFLCSILIVPIFFVFAESGEGDGFSGVYLPSFFCEGGVDCFWNLSIEDVLIISMEFLGIVIVLVATLGIMVGGAYFVFSGGDEGRLSRGKDIIFFSIIGLVVTLLSYLIVTLLSGLLYGISETS